MLSYFNSITKFQQLKLEIEHNLLPLGKSTQKIKVC